MKPAFPILAAFLLTPVFAGAAAPAIPATPSLPVSLPTAKPNAPAVVPAGTQLPVDLQKDISTTQQALSAKTDALKKALGADTGTLAVLTNVTSALASGNYAAALGSLSSLSAAKLTPEQSKLASDVHNEASALILQKGIAAQDPALAGPVHDTVVALRGSNYPAAIQGLTALSGQAKLTAAQKDLLKTMLGQYAPAAKKAADAAASALGPLNSLGLGK